ncbi:MAG: response regulator [Treponema sp.]|jgi:two-component system response regulator YesN|nr:response regulator [Treponema sp.]
MLKLLIVDDELIIRNGIRGIIDWTQYGYEICGEAEDGPSAVETILKLQPDLVLLDLHLPGFSGLEVVKKTRADSTDNKNIHFLIITGYAEFEYVKEAINLDVDGYIEKPIDENILTERITSIAKKIKMKDPEEHRQMQFREIMEGGYKEEINGPLCFNSEYVQAVFVSVENQPSEEAARQMQILRNFFQKDICHIFPYKEFTVFLFEDMPETAIKRLLEDFCDYLEKNGACCAVTLGSRYREEKVQPGSGIQKTCREAEKLMENIFFYRGKKYLSLDDLRDKKSAGPDWDNDETVKKLCSYIQAVDLKRIRSFFEELEASFFRSGKKPQEIRQECMELMIEVHGELLKKFPALREKPGTGRETLDAIMRQRYLGVIVDTMTESCLQISGSLPLLSADLSFQRIISYVKNNYNEDLSLETLGQLFYYNGAYLGKRFKEFTGKNFHTYLDTLRIDAAKEMLQNTDMKVYEISSAVGYANTDYFYSKFKKYTGKSPMVLRKEE